MITINVIYLTHEYQLEALHVVDVVNEFSAEPQRIKCEAVKQKHYIKNNILVQLCFYISTIIFLYLYTKKHISLHISLVGTFVRALSFIC